MPASTCANGSAANARTMAVVQASGSSAAQNRSCASGATSADTSTASPPSSRIAGWTGKISRLTGTSTSDRLPKLSRLKGVVVICAASVAASGAPSSADASAKTRPPTKRASTRSLAAPIGKANSARPSVAATLNWKPRSHSTNGSSADSASTTSVTDVGT